MLIFLNQELYRYAVALIGITIVIGSRCLCIQATHDGTDNSNNYLNLIDATFASATATNEFSNKEDNEVFTSTTDTTAVGENPDKFTPYLNISQYPGELCNRVCVSGQQRVCYFEFTLEYYQAMGVACGKCAQGVEEDCNNPQCIVGDGVEKGVMSINRQIPGPAIQVCKNDLLIIDVHNNAHGSAAALHWHGLHMLETPFMDGVPFLTQCPIPFANTFRYQFYATEPGTQFYHSHAGHHKVNGQYGALIVRQAQENEPLSNLYDYDLPEHHILISDWMHTYAEQYFPGLPSSRGIFPNSVLINGRGVYTNPRTKQQTKVPPTVYYVTPGKRYRFRLINSISHACPFQMQIEKHNLTIIASDSYDVLPRPFDTLVTNSGERYDFILVANHTKGDFWIRVKGMGVCSINPTESFALLRYESNEIVNRDEDLQVPDFPKYEEGFQPGIYLNHPNATCWGGENDHCITELTALEEDVALRNAVPDHKFFLAFHNYPVPNKEIFKPGQYNHFSNLNGNLTIVGAINNLSLVFPDYPPLTQPEDIDESQFCDDLNWPAKCAGNHLCPCIHRLQVERNSIVELIIVDESENVGRMHHPFHLHGYRFMVTGLGQHPDGVPMSIQRAKQMERNRMLPRDYFNARPPFKDTISIPSRGYAVIRFRATNPGFWLMHCHYEWHLAIGMGLILQVGTPQQMVTAPSDFPRCGNYVPPVKMPNF
ncbi:hypothetical protein FF38_00341 [Lucilia cuprina]|uniref:Uncharacterized protein n=1 Tax=Lucilia cuprina TaxID=7375 RepID=A0A0L0CD92_LUCCU|nr:Laccase-2 [Lucilia cuprina]KNC29434.1 hypothetical protein FF38_00341 [Lucilia cuprina]